MNEIKDSKINNQNNKEYEFGFEEGKMSIFNSDKCKLSLLNNEKHFNENKIQKIKNDILYQNKELFNRSAEPCLYNNYCQM